MLHCLLRQRAHRPITWQQLGALSQVDMVKKGDVSHFEGGERGGFTNRCWSAGTFTTSQPSLGFTQHEQCTPKNKGGRGKVHNSSAIGPQRDETEWNKWLILVPSDSKNWDFPQLFFVRLKLLAFALSRSFANVWNRWVKTIKKKKAPGSKWSTPAVNLCHHYPEEQAPVILNTVGAAQKLVH